MKKINYDENAFKTTHCPYNQKQEDTTIVVGSTQERTCQYFRGKLANQPTILCKYLESVYKEKRAALVDELGLCSCGMVERTIKYIYNNLKLVADKKFGKEDMPKEDYFFIYWANDKGYVDHSTSIEWAWLTDKGRNLLFRIEEMFSSDDTDGFEEKEDKQETIHLEYKTVEEKLLNNILNTMHSVMLSEGREQKLWEKVVEIREEYIKYLTSKGESDA